MKEKYFLTSVLSLTVGFCSLLPTLSNAASGRYTATTRGEIQSIILNSDRLSRRLVSFMATESEKIEVTKIEITGNSYEESEACSYYYSVDIRQLNNDTPMTGFSVSETTDKKCTGPWEVR